MIKIYTDGSCIENPGNGGWAAIIFMNNEKIAITGNKKNTTNNQMELMAAIEALKKIPTGQKVQVYTDSKYVKLGITEWIEKWSQNNWKTSSKQKVKNLAQQANSCFNKSTNSFDREWKEFDKIMTKNNISRKECLLLPINTMLDALSKKSL